VNAVHQVSCSVSCSSFIQPFSLPGFVLSCTPWTLHKPKLTRFQFSVNRDVVVIAPKNHTTCGYVQHKDARREVRSIPHNMQRNIKRFSVTFRNADDFNHIQFL